MSTVKTKKVQLGTDATASNNFTLYQPSTPDGTLRIGVGNADSPTEVGRFNSSGYVATNAPAFYAFLDTNQSITSGVSTVVQLDAERYDTNNCFDTSTYRFTPNVAGYYQINAMTRRSTPGTSLAGYWIDILKNGSVVYRGSESDSNSSSYHPQQIQANTMVYLNGSTDYIQLQVFMNGTGSLSLPDDGGGGGVYTSSMSGFLVRAA